LTRDCKFLGQTKCGICEQFGYKTKDYYLRKAKDLKKKEELREDKSDRKGKWSMKKQRREEMNQEQESGVETDEEHVVFSLNEPSKFTFDALEEGQFLINQMLIILVNIIPPPIYYDWLADSATTSHVANQHEAFTKFYLLTGTTVSGVGNVKAKAEGQGTVELILICNGHKYIL
jgi:formamidopyrimidine-DNA glycosylase